MIDKIRLLDYIQTLSRNDTKSLMGKSVKTQDEVGDLGGAILAFTGQAGATHKFVEASGVFDEAIDVILCALSCAYDVGATHEEIFEHMFKKASYWEYLQKRELKDDSTPLFPLPFEVHLTVALPAEGYTDDFFDEFSAACTGIGCKPVHLALPIGIDDIEHVVMTSMRVMGDNSNATSAMSYQSLGLTKAGFVVTRRKIETVPWHPAAPKSAEHPRMLSGQYFECHTNFSLTGTDADRTAVALFLKNKGCVTSQNMRKAAGVGVVSCTFRTYACTYPEFQTDCRVFAEELKYIPGVTVLDQDCEFSLYDSNVEADAAWMGAA